MDLRERFESQGLAVLPGFLSAAELTVLDSCAERFESEARPPFELESALGYPGAPAPGCERAGAVRRFLQVVQRAPELVQLLSSSGLPSLMAELLPEPRLVLAHHNSLMTKRPRCSSDTPWHRDLRYWSYSRGELVSVWIPLGPERPELGGLWVVPGSHRAQLGRGDFDGAQALRLERPAGARLVERAVPVLLERRDLLLFHCRLLHRASRNHGQRTKRSFVFSFRGREDLPLPGTRSAQGGELALGGIGDGRDAGRPRDEVRA